MNYVDSLSLSIFMNIIYKYVLVFINYLIKMKHLVLITFMKVEEVINCFYAHVSEFRSMRVRVLQRIKNRHKNYSSTLSLSFQMRIWVYENWDTESTRNSTVDSQRHWVYENFYRQFSETLSLQEFKSHTNFNISLTIKVQITYNLQKTLHDLHVISLISLMMLELSLLSI